MGQDVVVSKFKSQTSRGQMQDQSPSSVYDKTLPEITKVAPPNAVVPGLDHRDTIGARTSGSEPFREPWNANRTSLSGSPGGKVADNNRPVTRPATPDSFER